MSVFFQLSSQLGVGSRRYNGLLQKGGKELLLSDINGSIVCSCLLINFFARMIYWLKTLQTFLCVNAAL